MKPLLRTLAGIVAALLLGGCATLGLDRPLSAGDKLDPWERWNRKVFAFNEALDEHVLKPVATGYRNLVPELVRNMVSNVVNNLADGWSAVNLFLQGRVTDGLHDTTRFVTNSTFGLFGVLDIASEMGLEHHYEDFGQTLGKWGLGPGAYIVWPVLGPSSVRETLALPLDRIGTPTYAFREHASQLAVYTVTGINTRANLLGASRVIDEIALDKYTFVRDGYLARRRSLVYDGDPPPTKDDDDARDEQRKPAAPEPAASEPAK